MSRNALVSGSKYSINDSLAQVDMLVERAFVFFGNEAGFDLDQANLNVLAVPWELSCKDALK
jgi:hypothetical protein